MHDKNGKRLYPFDVVRANVYGMNDDGTWGQAERECLIVATCPAATSCNVTLAASPTFVGNVTIMGDTAAKRDPLNGAVLKTGTVTSANASDCTLVERER